MKTTAFIISLFIGTNVFAQQLMPTSSDALVKIQVSDFNNLPRKNDIIVLKAPQSGIVYKCITDKKGYGELLVPKGSTYNISYKTIGNDEKYDSFAIPQTEGLYTATLTIQYEPAKTITLENVYFDFNKSTLKATSFTSLDELADFMSIKATMIIEIAGHTDNVGDSTYNKTLSQARAESVRAYLIKKGISADRLVAKGYGEEQPVASNADDAGKQMNRRTEIRIVSE